MSNSNIKCKHSKILSKKCFKYYKKLSLCLNIVNPDFVNENFVIAKQELENFNKKRNVANFVNRNREILKVREFFSTKVFHFFTLIKN